MTDVSNTLAAWSSTTANNAPFGSTAVGTGLDDNLREIQGVIVRGLSHKGSDIASGSTTDLGAVEGLSHDITGTTTITSFGSGREGLLKIIKFEGALTLTHNATSLIIPGGANVTTADGDIAIVESEGSGNWRVVGYFKSATGALVNAATTSAQGVSEFATSAEILTGTDTARSMTPGDFAGNKSLAASGYYKLPGGLIIQWDSVSTNGSGTATWTYPTAFSSAVYFVGGVDHNGNNNRVVNVGTPNTSNVAVYTITGNTNTGVSSAAYMLAIGV